MTGNSRLILLAGLFLCSLFLSCNFRCRPWSDIHGSDPGHSPAIGWSPANSCNS